MSRKLRSAFLALIVLAGCVLPATASLQTDNSIETFWAKFKAAVTSGNKESVAAMTQFPVTMPYGQRSIRTKADLLKRYKSVFNSEANAAKCFATEKPEQDAARPREFTVGCDNGSGEKVVIYSFVLTKTGWRFKGLDNINE